MRIKSIRLSNGYKRFLDTTIDLGENPPRIVALVGSNGCGKSSIFDGILFLNAQYGVNVGGEGQKSNEYHSMSSDVKINLQDIKIDFSEGTFSEVFQARRTNGSHQSMISFRSPYRYNSALKVTATQSADDIGLNNYGASAASSIDQKMEQNYRRLSAKYHQYLESVDCKPSEAKAHIIGELNRSIKSCLDIEVSSLGSVEENRGSIYFVKYDQPQPFEFDVLSSGEKEVVDILLDLYLRSEKYTETVFLIDEPELHINTSIQKKLLIEMENLIGDDCQIWVATHSIGLLRALQEDLRDECEVIYFEPGTKFASEAIKLKPMVKNHANWRKVFATAIDDLAGLVSPKKIIYCEGKGEPRNGAEDGFDAKVFNQVFGKEFSDTLFVSSGGNTELDQRSSVAISILSKVFTDVEILVLKDRDFASGKNTTEEDRLTYLMENPENHRILIRWEIENYLFDQEVLQAYCNANGLTFDKERYLEFVQDICNQNIKDSANEFKEMCSLNENLSTENFKFQLASCISPEMAVFTELKSCIFQRG